MFITDSTIQTKLKKLFQKNRNQIKSKTEQTKIIEFFYWFVLDFEFNFQNQTNLIQTQTKYLQMYLHISYDFFLVQLER